MRISTFTNNYTRRLRQTHVVAHIALEITTKRDLHVCPRPVTYRRLPPLEARDLP